MDRSASRPPRHDGASRRGAEEDDHPPNGMATTVSSAAMTTTMTTSPTTTTATSGSTGASGAVVVAAPKPPRRVRVKTERRREQCRRNQARYRNKERQYGDDLEAFVLQLRQQVHQLELQRSSLYNAVNSRDARAKSVVEYLGLFRHGIHVQKDQVSTSTSCFAWSTRTRQLNTSSTSVAALLSQQIAFVRASYDDDVRIGDGTGPEAFLDQLYGFAKSYHGISMELVALESVQLPDDCTSVQTQITMRMTITPATIRQVFPHLLHPAHQHIKWKLLGQQLCCPASAAYIFNAQSKISQLDWTIDFVTALQHLLTIDETAVVLQQAQIVRDAYLVFENGDQIQPAAHPRMRGDEEIRQEDLAWNHERQMNTTGTFDGDLARHDGEGDGFVMVSL